MKFIFSAVKTPTKGTVVVGALEKAKLLPTAKALDEKSDGAISRAIKSSKFKGNKGQTLELNAPPVKGIDKILLVGIGKPDEVKEVDAQDLGGKIYAHVAQAGKDVSVVLDDVSGKALDNAEVAANVAYGILLRSYRFDKYRTKEKEDAKPTLTSATIQAGGHTAAKKQFATLQRIAEGVFYTRDLVSEPANVLYPDSFAREVRSLQKLGVKVEVLTVKQMQAKGMNALLGVGQGSTHDSRLVVLHWKGPRGKAGVTKTSKPIAFVGKGVTFDTGGISIKPAAGMEDMKWDMGGAGTVSGLFKALAGRKAKVEAVGILGLVENMPSGTAQRPGDVVKSMSGQTIEVINTDAEGRLVLADAITYVIDRFDPKAVIDLATLTGAIIVSLGQEMAGVFSNNDDLVDRLKKSGDATGEHVWHMPLGEEYDKLINSDIADMKNIGGRWGGAITAAQFIKRFIDKDSRPWAHIDIAGMTWSKKTRPTVPKGGTGYGVRLLDRLVRDYYEKK